MIPIIALVTLIIVIIIVIIPIQITVTFTTIMAQHFLSSIIINLTLYFSELDFILLFSTHLLQKPFTFIYVFIF